MVYFYIRHCVEDFKQWREVYEAHRSTRKNRGCKNEWLFQDENDQNDVFLLFAWEDFESANEFLNSNDLKEKMENAGVKGKPETKFLSLIEALDLSQEEIGGQGSTSV